MRLMRSAGAILLGFILFTGISATQQTVAQPPKPIGKMVDLGGHRLHVNCAGKGSPTVVFENGFDEFSFDWILVQSKVAEFTRACSYDRPGYAWSDPGPKPRTFAQINLELRDALSMLGERGPYVLVGHSFGGPAVRNFAILYPGDVIGIVFVDGVSEDSRFSMWKKAVLMRSGAQGKVVPPPHEAMLPTDKPQLPSPADPSKAEPIEPPFDRLPPDIQNLHLWAHSQLALGDAEEGERTWSPEYFQRWHDAPQSARLGSIPLIVLSREKGGYDDSLDIPGVLLEAERRQLQEHLAALSTRGKQTYVASGHNMQLEAPAAVVQAIRDVIAGSRNSSHP